MQFTQGNLGWNLPKLTRLINRKEKERNAVRKQFACCKHAVETEYGQTARQCRRTDRETHFESAWLSDSMIN